RRPGARRATARSTRPSPNPSASAVPAGRSSASEGGSIGWVSYGGGVARLQPDAGRSGGRPLAAMARYRARVRAARVRRSPHVRSLPVGRDHGGAGVERRPDAPRSPGREYRAPPARHDGLPRDVPPPGSAREGRDDGGSDLERSGAAGDRRGVVGPGAPVARHPLPPCTGTIRDARGAARDRARPVVRRGLLVRGALLRARGVPFPTQARATSPSSDRGGGQGGTQAGTSGGALGRRGQDRQS